MKTSISTNKPPDNVVQLFGYEKRCVPNGHQLVRLSAEHDGIAILYSNKYTDSDKLYSMDILCWGLQANGDVVGIIPWLNKVSSCLDLDDPYYGQWEGYYDPVTQDLFFDPLEHKVLELEKSAEYFGELDQNPETIIQEIPDVIGTHAMLNSRKNNSLILTDVLSWRLYGDGHLEAMIIDETLVNETPILPGDPCLYPASKNPDFRYFFQHHIANQIKSENPEALAAIELLLDN